MAAPLLAVGAPPVRAAGSEVLIRYDLPDPPEWHARLVLTDVGGDGHLVDYYIVFTPDMDIYAEDLGSANPDTAALRDRPADRSIPYGIPAAQVYDFANLPSAAELRQLVGEAEGMAVAARARLGLFARDAAHPHGGVPAPGAVVVAPAAGAVVGGGQVAAGVPPPGLGAGPPPWVHAPAGGVPPAPPAPLPGGVPGGGVAALQAAALGSGVGAAVPAPVGQAVAVAGGAPTGDVRVLSVLYDTTGERFRNFSDSVQYLEIIKWPDSPVKGPVTVLWCCRFMKINGGSPSSWHHRWQALAKVQSSEPGVQAHDAFCRTLEIMLCFDQLSLGSLASAEYVCRQIQLVEEKYKEKAGNNANTEIVQEQHLFGGHSSRTNLCICPDLSAWIAEEMKTEAAVMKERRKAREERALQKPAAKS